MECHEFKKWMADREVSGERLTATAQEHLKVCERCRKLHMLDSIVETNIRESLRTVEVPNGLLARIEMNMRSQSKGKLFKPFPWKWFAPALAAAVLLLLLFNPFAGRLTSLEQVGSLAVENHLKNLPLTFKAGEVRNVPRWFEERLGFEMSMPDLQSAGLQFLGGRECRLGRANTAYLFYEKAGKKVSLFIINPGDLSFNLEPGTTYHKTGKQCDVKIWRAKAQLYAMVE